MGGMIAVRGAGDLEEDQFAGAYAPGRPRCVHQFGARPGSYECGESCVFGTCEIQRRVYRSGHIELRCPVTDRGNASLHALFGEPCRFPQIVLFSRRLYQPARLDQTAAAKHGGAGQPACQTVSQVDGEEPRLRFKANPS